MLGLPGAASDKNRCRDSKQRHISESTGQDMTGAWQLPKSLKKAGLPIISGKGREKNLQTIVWHFSGCLEVFCIHYLDAICAASLETPAGLFQGTQENTHHGFPNPA